MTSNDVRKKYLEFYKKLGHAEIPSARLVPENDPSTLFVSAGMQPLIQNILGQPHPSGKRLVNSQKAVRVQDIEEVGDNRHTTFFEMLGNWSLGDYFKQEQLNWIFEFLTGELSLNPKQLYISVFEGDSSVPKDIESIKIWQSIFSGSGIDAKEGERIFTYPATKNWWSRSGVPENMPPGEPGGPDSEVFFDYGPELLLHEKSPFKSQKCHLNCDCGRYLEIANSVFMQYQKQEDGSVRELSQKSVDFGGGLERLVAVTDGKNDIFETDLFWPLIKEMEKISKCTYGKDIQETRAMRIIADHIKCSVMMLSDGVIPSNKQQGYILRRLIRRALLHGRKLELFNNREYLRNLVSAVSEIYLDAYPEVSKQQADIEGKLIEEASRFGKTLEKGLREIEKVGEITGQTAFTLYETYGFPWEMTVEIAETKGQYPNRGEFEAEFKKHQEMSRTAAKGMFKGGLADHSEEVTKLHTATHLLHQALRLVLGDHVSQKGSNITAERLRFDFSHPTKLTDEEIRKVESIVNDEIRKNLPVTFTTMTYEEAIGAGALAFFGERYPKEVKVYSAGDFSREICGGPHVTRTGLVGRISLFKEESAGAGIRRIYGKTESANPA